MLVSCDSVPKGDNTDESHFAGKIILELPYDLLQNIGDCLTDEDVNNCLQASPLFTKMFDRGAVKRRVQRVLHAKCNVVRLRCLYIFVHIHCKVMSLAVHRWACLLYQEWKRKRPGTSYKIILAKHWLLRQWLLHHSGKSCDPPNGAMMAVYRIIPEYLKLHKSGTYEDSRFYHGRSSSERPVLRKATLSTNSTTCLLLL